jgi:hypothetical protein
LSTQIFCLLGPVPDSEYDRPVPVSDEMHCLAREASTVVERYQSAGRPLWARVLSSMLTVFLKEPVVGGLSFVLTWDASPHGWAAQLRWWDTSKETPVLRDLLLVGSWPAGENIADQAHREALAAPLAMEAACQAADLPCGSGCSGTMPRLPSPP